MKTILLIDDDVNLTEIIALRLKTCGYTVVTAPNGAEALEKLQQVTPDLIVLDLNMPTMGGIEFYHTISTAHSEAKYPVLVLTGRANFEQAFRDLDVDGFMSKPFEAQELLKEIERILSKEGKETVLLVDVAEKSHMQEIQRALEEERYKVIVIENTDTLIHQLPKEKPDYILVEYMRIDMRGEECIKKIKHTLSHLAKKEWPSASKVPLIVYSYSGFDYKEKSIHAGGDYYLGKPQSPEVIISALKEFRIKKRTKKHD